MKSRVKLPKLGEVDDTVLVLSWERSLGERVEAGETLMLVETAKVEAEVPSPLSGTLVELLVEEDEEISTGTAICVIDQAT